LRGNWPAIRFAKAAHSDDIPSCHNLRLDGFGSGWRARGQGARSYSIIGEGMIMDLQRTNTEGVRPID
jgi:hypothetical protein